MENFSPSLKDEDIESSESSGSDDNDDVDDEDYVSGLDGGYSSASPEHQTTIVATAVDSAGAVSDAIGASNAVTTDAPSQGPKKQMRLMTNGFLKQNAGHIEAMLNDLGYSYNLAQKERLKKRVHDAYRKSYVRNSTTYRTSFTEGGMQQMGWSLRQVVRECMQNSLDAFRELASEGLPDNERPFLSVERQPHPAPVGPRRKKKGFVEELYLIKPVFPSGVILENKTNFEGMPVGAIEVRENMILLHEAGFFLKDSAFEDIDSSKGGEGKAKNVGGWGFGWRQASLVALKLGVEVGVIQYKQAVSFTLSQVKNLVRPRRLAVKYESLDGSSKQRGTYEGHFVSVVIGAHKSQPWDVSDAFHLEDYLELCLNQKLPNQAPQLRYRMGDGPLVLLPPLKSDPGLTELPMDGPPKRTRRKKSTGLKKGLGLSQEVGEQPPQVGEEAQPPEGTSVMPPEELEDLGPNQLRTGIEAGWLYCKGIRVQKRPDLEALGISLEVPGLQPTPDRSTFMGEHMPLKYLETCLGKWTWDARLNVEAAGVFENQRDLGFLHKYIKKVALEKYGMRCIIVPANGVETAYNLPQCLEEELQELLAIHNVVKVEVAYRVREKIEASIYRLMWEVRSNEPDYQPDKEEQIKLKEVLDELASFLPGKVRLLWRTSERQFTHWCKDASDGSDVAFLASSILGTTPPFHLWYSILHDSPFVESQIEPMKMMVSKLLLPFENAWNEANSPKKEVAVEEQQQDTLQVDEEKQQDTLQVAINDCGGGDGDGGGDGIGQQEQKNALKDQDEDNDGPAWLVDHSQGDDDGPVTTESKGQGDKKRDWTGIPRVSQAHCKSKVDSKLTFKSEEESSSEESNFDDSGDLDWEPSMLQMLEALQDTKVLADDSKLTTNEETLGPSDQEGGQSMAVGVLEVFAGSCPVSRVPCLPAWRAEMQGTRLSVRLTLEKDEKVAERHALLPSQIGAQRGLKPENSLFMSGSQEGDVTNESVAVQATNWFAERLPCCDAVLVVGGPPCRANSQGRAQAPGKEMMESRSATVLAYLRIALRTKEAVDRLPIDERPLFGFVMENPVSNGEYSLYNLLQKDEEAKRLMRELGVDVARPTRHEWSAYDSMCPKKPTLIWSNLPLTDCLGPSQGKQRASTIGVRDPESGAMTFFERNQVVQHRRKKEKKSTRKRRCLKAGEDGEEELKGEGDHAGTVAHERGKWPDLFVKTLFDALRSMWDLKKKLGFASAIVSPEGNPTPVPFQGFKLQLESMEWPIY